VSALPTAGKVRAQVCVCVCEWGLHSRARLIEQERVDREGLVVVKSRDEIL
jgi:hypothetical protein